MNIVLLGPPGSGKGTQASKLANEYKLYKISSGDLLRDEINKGTSLGYKIKSIIDKGSLVSDDIINTLIKEFLLDNNLSKRFILDGYPRNLDQAKELNIMLKKINKKISCVLSLNVDKETVVKRIMGRQICSKCGSIFNEYYSPATKENHNCDIKFLQKRSDDNEEIIKKRFETYKEKTLPLLNFYMDQKLLHEINGTVEIDDIFKEIRGIIASIET